MWDSTTKALGLLLFFNVGKTKKEALKIRGTETERDGSGFGGEGRQNVDDQAVMTVIYTETLSRWGRVGVTREHPSVSKKLIRVCEQGRNLEQQA